MDGSWLYLTADRLAGARKEVKGSSCAARSSLRDDTPTNARHKALHNANCLSVTEQSDTNSNVLPSYKGNRMAGQDREQ